MPALQSVLDILNTYQGSCRRSIFGSHSAIAAAKKYIDEQQKLVNPNTSDTLTPDQKFALAQLFIRTHPVKAGSQSEKVWKKIINKHFPANTQKNSSAQTYAHADYVHADLQCLKVQAQGTNYAFFTTSGLAHLDVEQTSPIVALQVIVNAYEAKRNQSYIGTKHSSAMHEVTKIMHRLQLLTIQDGAYNTTIANKDKYDLIMSFFGNYGTTIKESSNSYAAFSSMITLFSTKPHLTKEDITSIYRNIIALKNGGHLNDKTKCVETLLACINDPKNFTVPAKASTSLFHGYARIAPELILPPYSIAELKALKAETETNNHGSAKNFIAKETLTSILTRGVEPRFKGESADLKTFYVNNCFYRGELMGSQTFSEPAAIFTQLKEFLAPLTDLSTLASKLKNLLKDISSEDSDKIPMAMKQYLFLQCTQFPTDPEFNPILWQLIPKEFIFEQQPNTLSGIIKIMKDAYVKIESPIPNTEDSYVRFIEDADLEAIALKTKKSSLTIANEDLVNILHSLPEESPTYQSTLDKLLPNSTIIQYLKEETASIYTTSNTQTAPQLMPTATEQNADPKQYKINLQKTFEGKDGATLKDALTDVMRDIYAALPRAAYDKLSAYLAGLKDGEITGIPLIDCIRIKVSWQLYSPIIGDSSIWKGFKKDLLKFPEKFSAEKPGVDHEDDSTLDSSSSRSTSVSSSFSG